MKNIKKSKKTLSHQRQKLKWSFIKREKWEKISLNCEKNYATLAISVQSIAVSVRVSLRILNSKINLVLVILVDAIYKK